MTCAELAGVSGLNVMTICIRPGAEISRNSASVEE